MAKGRAVRDGIGARILEARQQAHPPLSQAKVGALFGVSQSAVSEWEDGENLAGHDRFAEGLAALADATGSDLHYLCSGVPNDAERIPPPQSGKLKAITFARWIGVHPKVLAAVEAVDNPGRDADPWWWIHRIFDEDARFWAQRPASPDDFLTRRP